MDFPWNSVRMRMSEYTYYLSRKKKRSGIVYL